MSSSNSMRSIGSKGVAAGVINPVSFRADYEPAKHNPSRPQRGGSTDAFSYPSRFGGELRSYWGSK